MGRSAKVAVVIGSGIAGVSCAAALSHRFSAVNGVDLRVVIISPSPVVRVANLGPLRTSELTVSDAGADEWAAEAGVTIVRGLATAISGRSITLEDSRTLTFDVCCVATGARPSIPACLSTDDAEIRKRVLTLRDTDSVEALRESLADARCVAVVGNGGIALELAHEILGCDVVWIIRDQHIGSAFFDVRGGEVLSRFLQIAPVDLREDAELAPKREVFSGAQCMRSSGRAYPAAESIRGAGVGPNWTRQWDCPKPSVAIPAEESGTSGFSRRAVRIRRGCEVCSLARNAELEGLPLVLSLTTGATVECDYVISATGVVPNVEWLGKQSGVVIDDPNCANSGAASGRSAGLSERGGILVRAGSMQSCSRDDVFAAGDCASIVPNDGDSTAPSPEDANWFQRRLWTQAAQCGKAAAACMAAYLCGESFEDAADSIHFELFAHATRFFGRRVVLLGRYNAQGLKPGYRILEGGGGTEDESFARAVVEEGKLRGAVLIGETELGETYENLILDGLDVSHLGAELVDPSVDLADYFD